jgi:hypothetical protein
LRAEALPENSIITTVLGKKDSLIYLISPILESIDFGIIKEIALLIASIAYFKKNILKNKGPENKLLKQMFLRTINNYKRLGGFLKLKIGETAFATISDYSKTNSYFI